MNRLFFLFILLLRFHGFAQSGNHNGWGYWKTWGAQPQGRYQNPILPADFSDIDCIRVGQDYFAISSTFQYSPGIIILKSSDLVNWRIAGHAVDHPDTISPEMGWKKMDRYGRGIWAGAIRFHGNKFWIYFGTPDEGYFVTTAAKAEGPWSPLHQVLEGKGWDDCCPYWDDNGEGYLVGTDFKNNYRIHLFKLSADGLGIDSTFDRVIHQSDGSEANKLYKMRGWYYHLFSEVKPEGRVLMMERSKRIGGPYRQQKQLNHAGKNAHEPNQGGLVQTGSGAWFFLTHHGSGDWSGRPVSLLPVTWINDWPIIGVPGRDGIGNMVWSGKIPEKESPTTRPQSSDDFDSVMLQPQWEWNYQPRQDKWSLTGRPGWLRLYASRPLKQNDLHSAANTLTQRVYRSRSGTVDIKIDIARIADGGHAGLAQYGYPDYAGIGVVDSGADKRLEFRQNNRVVTGLKITGNDVWLRVKWGLNGRSLFSYSLDGIHFIRFGPLWAMKWESYRGSRLAIYHFNNQADSGFVDLDYLHYRLR